MVCVCFGVGISFLSGDYGRFPAWWWRFKNFSFSLSIAPQYGHLHSDFGESLVVDRQARFISLMFYNHLESEDGGTN